MAIGCSTPGVVIINGGDYSGLRVPHGWDIEIMPENIGLCGAMQHYFRTHPDEPFYGLACDDEYVYTPGWDTTLTKTAGSSFIAFGNDGWQSGRRQHGYVTWGGDLVRKVGFLSLPGLWHWYHDDVWEAIAERMALNRFCPNVHLEHKHYRAQKSEDDETYILGRSRSEADAGVYTKWYNEELPSLIARLKKEL
jgi:hypothetical protein